MRHVPDSHTHCWLAFHVERDRVRAGLLERDPDPREYRECCTRRQQPATPGAARRDPAEVSAP